MSSEQYRIFCQDYDRHNTFDIAMVCDCCMDQNKEITQNEMSITWGKVKDLKKIRKKSRFGISKNCKMEKKLYVNPKRKSWKNTNC